MMSVFRIMHFTHAYLRYQKLATKAALMSDPFSAFETGPRYYRQHVIYAKLAGLPVDKHLAHLYKEQQEEYKGD